MQLISINIGKAQPIQAKSGQSGIYKKPAIGRVQVTALGLVGDAICDVESHGGVDQALYVFGARDYAWWSRELGQELPAGTFGENLTISELESAAFNVGDRLRIGDVVIEITSPRIPCVTLSVRMGDPQFTKRFRDAERPGFYCRVIQAGWLEADQPVTVEPYQGERISVREFFRDYFLGDWTEARMRRYLNVPISIRDREDMERKLKKMGA